MCIAGKQRVVFLPAQNQTIWECPEVFNSTKSGSPILHVYSEVGPTDPHSLRAALKYVYETVLFFSPVIIEEFRPSLIAFEELIRQRGAGRQFEPRAVTRLVRKHETIVKVFPVDDERFFGI